MPHLSSSITDTDTRLAGVFGTFFLGIFTLSCFLLGFICRANACCCAGFALFRILFFIFVIVVIVIIVAVVFVVILAILVILVFLRN